MKEELAQYHFNREDFVRVFKEIFSVDEIVVIVVACQEQKLLDNFLLYYTEDEYYIIDLKSGIIINWYKHLGRCNTCNNEHFTLKDLRNFLEILKKTMYM